MHTRTAQVESIAFTLPFLKTPKMFGTFTVAPSWLVHTAGLNQDNHAQLYQILYLGEPMPNWICSCVAFKPPTAGTVVFAQLPACWQYRAETPYGL